MEKEERVEIAENAEETLVWAFEEEIIPEESPQIAAETEEAAEAEAEEAAQAEETVETAAEEVPAKASPLKKLCKCRKKWPVIAAVLAVAILALVGSMLAPGGGSGEKKYGLFFKDQEIYLLKNSGKSLRQITRNFWNGEDADPEDTQTAAGIIGLVVHVRKNGDRIFFPDKLGNDAAGINMYYQDLKGNKEPVKIDSEITSFHVDEDGEHVVYLKGREKKLYIHDLERKERIDDEVTRLFASDDLKTIAYLTEDDDFHYWQKGKGSKKLAIEVETVYYDTDWSEFYFLKDGTLYRQSIGTEERTTLAEEVAQVVAVYESGEVCYVKENTVVRNMMDYVNDDLLEADSKLTQPAKPKYPDPPEYPYSWRYDSDDEYEDAKKAYEKAAAEYEKTYEKMKADYEKACEDYEKKLERDELREELKDSSKEYKEYALYYHNGTEEILLTEKMTGMNTLRHSGKKPVMQYNVYNTEGDVKVNLSDIDSVYDVSNMIEEALYSASDVFISVGPNAVLLEENDAKSFVISPEGTEIYYLDDVDEEGNGDLYRVAIRAKEKTADIPQLFDSGVSEEFGMRFLEEDSSIVYAKEVDGTEKIGDLYVGGTLLDYDMYLQDISFRDGRAVYFSDWDSEGACGMLHVKKLGEESAALVGEEIHDYAFTGDGNLLYLNDYSTKYGSGVLFHYSVNKDASSRVAYDVSALIHIPE